MADISLSKAVRTNLLSLQNTASMMATTQERLATGNKVNSALDNPTNFFTASSLNSRASDMNNLMDSMANGIKTLEAADNGMKALTKNLEQMQSTLRQARQDKSFQTGSYTLDATTAGTSAIRDLDFSGGAFSTTESIVVHNAVKTGNNGFNARGGTIGKDVTITLAATGFNGDTAYSVSLLKTDTAATSAEKINTALKSAVGGAGGLSASVVNGQLSVSSSVGATVTFGGSGNASEEVGLLARSAVTKVNATIVGPQANTNFHATNGSAAISFKVNGETIDVAANTGATTAALGGADIAAAINAKTATTGVTAASDNAGIMTLTDASGNNISVEGTNANLKSAGLIATASSATTAASTNGVVAAAAVTTVAQVNAVKDVSQLVSEINESADFMGKIRASNDNGKLRIENLSTTKLNIAGISSGGAVDGTSSGAASILGNAVRTDLAEQFNELRDQLDKLSDDASFNGTNLLRGDNLKITFNETGTSSIEIRSKGGESLNGATLNLTDIDPAELDSDASIDAMVDTVKAALNTVRSQSSAFGANLTVVQNRQEFTSNMINTLETGAANLTLADMNQEAANMMALQTRQSLASSTLSMANQADQSVLQLLR